MKKSALIVVSLLVMLFSCKTETVEDLKYDKAVKIHQGSFAFCGASSAFPTGRKIIVQGVEYDEGCAICPVLTGPSLSNLAMQGISGTYGRFNVNENFQTPDGTNNTVWSLFWYYDSTTTIPQFNPESWKWELLPPVNRAFVVNLDCASTSWQTHAVAIQRDILRSIRRINTRWNYREFCVWFRVVQII